MIPRLLAVLAVVSLSAGPAHAQSTSLPPGGTFLDDETGAHEGAIEAMVAAGLTNGCAVDPPRYCPDRPVTRGEMAAFLSRALEIPAPDPGDLFVDDDGSPHEGAIDAMVAAGIMDPCQTGPGRFCPDDPVHRGEMATFLVRAVVGEGDFDPAPDAFGDDEGNIHEPAIDRIALIGLTRGCAEGRFCPDGEVTRGEIASFLTRTLGLAEMSPPPRPPVELVSEFTTYHRCCEARVRNIHVMADALDGVVVYPGAVFSVNQRLGPRTSAKGYVDAPILLNGDSYCCAVGGGTSQFATTLYNAIFWGGYEILDHKPHSRYIDRYPLGIEATMGYPWPDVVFHNDTFTPVTIRTRYTSGSITVQLWGNDLGREVGGVVTGSATWSRGGSVKVVRSITEADGTSRDQTWFWTYLSG